MYWGSPYGSKKNICSFAPSSWHRGPQIRGIYYLLYANEMTPDWGPGGSFRVGTVYRKTKSWLEGWICPHTSYRWSPISGERWLAGGKSSVTRGQWQRCYEASTNTPLLQWGSESFWAHEHTDALERVAAQRGHGDHVSCPVPSLHLAVPEVYCL